MNRVQLKQQQHSRPCGTCKGTGLYARREFTTWLGKPDEDTMQCFTCNGNGRISRRPLVIGTNPTQQGIRVHATRADRAEALRQHFLPAKFEYLNCYDDVNGAGLSYAFRQGHTERYNFHQDVAYALTTGLVAGKGGR